MARSVSWEVTQSGPIRNDIQALTQRTRKATSAFNDVANVIADRQKAWFATGGGGTWAPRQEPYHRWMRKKFPKRKVMHGPDRKDRRGLQLRDDLTRRNNGRFGIENISSQGITVGTDLPYAQLHQDGSGNLPKRVVMPPLDTVTERKIVRILQAHIVGEVIG